MSQQDDELLVVITSWQRTFIIDCCWSITLIYLLIVGSLVFLLYEIAITFDDEVSFIWS